MPKLHRPCSKHLATSTGGVNAIGDYSTAAVTFALTPSTGEVYRVARMLIFVHSTDIVAGGYGSISTGLPTGMTVKVVSGATSSTNVIEDMLDGVTIQYTADWAEFCFDVARKAWGTSTNDEFMTASWTFEKSGNPLWLRGDADERLEIVINDSCTALIQHTFVCQGYDVLRST